MEKSAVISIRDSLLDNGKNKTLRIIFDNGMNVSLASDQIIWDDEKEIITGFYMSGQSGAFSANLPISILCSTYENIQFITGNININNLDKTIENLKNIINITDEDKKNIISYFSKICDYKYELKDDYYYHKKD